MKSLQSFIKRLQGLQKALQGLINNKFLQQGLVRTLRGFTNAIEGIHEGLKDPVTFHWHTQLRGQ